MRELFDKEKHITIDEIRNTNLIDTCFFIYALTHPKELDDLKKLKTIATTSFNVEEILNLKHEIKAGLRHILKRFVKEVDLNIIDINVKPGEREKEREFVENTDKNLLEHVHDPSDAILVAVGIKTHSNVYTRDKKHLFNPELENYLRKYDIKILNIIKIKK
jgi:hypothetical protein